MASWGFFWNIPSHWVGRTAREKRPYLEELTRTVPDPCLNVKNKESSLPTELMPKGMGSVICSELVKARNWGVVADHFVEFGHDAA